VLVWLNIFKRVSEGNETHNIYCLLNYVNSYIEIVQTRFQYFTFIDIALYS
jgi:hypothetical protein